MKPKVSICIPAYRQPDLLRTILDSVFAQSFQDFEVIVTDDSDDESLGGVVREFNHERRLTYVRNKKRLGSPINWNFALSLSSGEYIKFLHHDDWFSEKDSLSRFVAMLNENPLADFAFSSTLVYGPGHQYRYTHSPSEEQLRRLKANPYSLFFRKLRRLAKHHDLQEQKNRRFDPRLKWLVDIDFYMSILREKRRFIYSSHPLVCTTQGAPHQVTRECVSDRQLQVYEFVRVYDKVGKNPRYMPSYLKFMLELFKSHSVRSKAEIVRLGIEEPLSVSIRGLILLTRLSSGLRNGNRLLCGRGADSAQ